MMSRLRAIRFEVLAVLLVLVGMPAELWAEDLWFRNDTGVPIIIQGSCVAARGRVVTDRPKLVQPGDKVRIILPGNKLITIRDARAPGTVVHKETIPAAAQDHFVIITSPAAGKAKLEETTAKEFLAEKK
jgi:hypothetical protein